MFSRSAESRWFLAVDSGGQRRSTAVKASACLRQPLTQCSSRRTTLLPAQHVFRVVSRRRSANPHSLISLSGTQPCTISSTRESLPRTRGPHPSKKTRASRGQPSQEECSFSAQTSDFLSIGNLLSTVLKTKWLRT